MKNNRRANNNQGVQTPSYTSPNNSARACLCKDSKTYSKECCNGTLWAQGIGVIQKVT